MPLDPDKLRARVFSPIRHAYTRRDVQLYALGVGIGDPLDEGALRYVYEGIDGRQLRIMPTFFNVVAYPGFWAREPDSGVTWRRLLHAEQEIRLHAPAPCEGTVIGTNRITGLWDRGAEKGAFLRQERELRDESGRLLAEVSQLLLLRADGGFDGSDPEGPPPAHQVPQRAPDAVCDLPTLPQAALIYRLSGDLNPLHADPAIARAAGFDRPILHGLATMGVAAHAVMRTLLDYDPTRLAGMRVRFTAPVFPGETLRSALWVDGDTVSLRMTAAGRGMVVLDNTRVDLRPANADL